MREKIKIMLTTEGTYPFHQGGVSTWCDQLVQGLDHVEYVVYSVVMDPFVTQKFELPASASLVKMPLWGTEEPSEHFDQPFSQSFLAKKRTTSHPIDKYFIPLFEALIKEIIHRDNKPEKLANILLDLHLYFQYYEYKISFKSEEAWEVYKRIVLDYVKDKDSGLSRPDVYSLIQSLGWIYRFLNILNTPIPDVDVTHSSAAGFSGIPCVLSKLKNRTPYMLTEHGVYIREQYISLSKRDYSSFLNTFLMRLVNSVTRLSYVLADQVSPVCEYNTRWERELGVPQEKIKVIYNGVNQDVFLDAAEKKSVRPTVVTVARIDPIKDIEMLIKASAKVREQIPDVQFLVYGSITVQSYYEQCLKLRKKLDLEKTVIFVGHTSDIASAYKSGDIVALTSISEAFPYSVVEAMMAKKVVISTDVGGIKEALGDCGVLVPARDDEKLAKGIIKLFHSPEQRTVMAEEGQERALSMFTLEKMLKSHALSYDQMLNISQSLSLVVNAEVAASVSLEPAERLTDSEGIQQQRLSIERGYALKYAGYSEQALECFRQAIDQASSSLAVPALLLETAELYNHLSLYESAFLELEKHQILLMDNELVS